MSDSHNTIKSLFMFPGTDPMKEARRHLGIIEIDPKDIPLLLGFDSNFILQGIELKDDKLRLKLQHPLFPRKKEGECITIIPLITK